MEAVRPATLDDLGRLVELYRMAQDELAPTRGGELLFLREARRDPLEASFKPALDDPDRGMWVGTIDGFVVGYAAVRIEELPSGYRLGVIEDLFVESEARSVGVGEAMAGAVLDWFANERCGGADAMALPGNRATKNFFEETGFTARLLVMHKSLSATPESPVEHG